MRVQSINSNNYQKNSPNFKANVHSVVDLTCHDGELCYTALSNLAALFEKMAVKAGHVKAENCSDIFISKGSKGLDLLLVDNTTKLMKDIRDPKPSLEKVFENAKTASDTVQLPLSVKEEDVCPAPFVVKNLITSLFGL